SAGRAAPDAGLQQRAAHLLADLHEIRRWALSIGRLGRAFPNAFIVEQQGSLRKGLARLVAGDIRLNMAVGDKSILPAVVVVVEEEEAKTKRLQTGLAHARLVSAVGEGEGLVPLHEKGVRLAGEVADEDGALAVIAVVGHIYAHAGAGRAVAAVGDSGLLADILERAVAPVPKEMVGRQVVGNDNIGAAIAVQVPDRH